MARVTTRTILERNREREETLAKEKIPRMSRRADYGHIEGGLQRVTTFFAYYYTYNYRGEGGGN